jgi:hypothetical protein
MAANEREAAPDTGAADLELLSRPLALSPPLELAAAEADLAARASPYRQASQRQTKECNEFKALLRLATDEIAAAAETVVVVVVVGLISFDAPCRRPFPSVDFLHSSTTEPTTAAAAIRHCAKVVANGNTWRGLALQ